jgi:hypothetical protein
MIQAIAAAAIASRIAAIALGETIRLLGSAALLIAGRDGITADAAQPQPLPQPQPVTITQDDSAVNEIAEILFPSQSAVYRQPLGRDPLTGALV